MVGYTVIGAGIAGLVLAQELKRLGASVEVIEYRERVGGIHALQPELAGLAEAASAELGVKLGASAVRVGDEIYAVGRDWHEKLGSSAVAATGFRAATLPELGIYGDRPAGVYVHQAVMDMMLYGLLPGRRVVVYGDNPYAAILSAELLRRGCEVKLVIAGDADASLGGLDVIRGSIKYVKGRDRVRGVLVNGEWVAADSLVVSFFKPFNPFPELRGVGQAVIDTYDSSVVMESSRILARELAAGGGGEAIEIDSDVPIYPGSKVSRDSRRIIVLIRSGVLFINDKEYVVRNGPAVVELPDVERAVIRGGPP
ncbi:hypothetical protein GCM10007981_04760 [Thermocladium modestius]|uniref:Monooxygenase n=1 Tax=Thermocladium modestius TaxID=62609 RepID=A0A830GTA9_9CREN|nr:FAD-dependent oxidoreductase [Thermocladium modestius]GGP19763.1 hypothetical protein GCM10007981_04760 [Thermocladium modestius]